MKQRKLEQATKGVFALSTVVTGSLAVLIFFFLFYFSMPLITSGHLGEFFSSRWDPDAHAFGIYPMIMGTVYIAMLATLLAAPLGISLAIFMEVIAPPLLSRFLRTLVEFMAGIPTVVYGFAALFLLVPLVRNIFEQGSGLCILTALLVLALLIIPTVTMISQDRLKNVPETYILAAKSLGASDVETLFYLYLPHTWKGILSAVVLGAGRAVGDTMIALMVAGNAVQIPSSLIDSARTLTSHIALVTAADYESISFKAIFICGLILFIFSAWNILFLRILGRLKR